MTMRSPYQMISRIKVLTMSFRILMSSGSSNTLDSRYFSTSSVVRCAYVFCIALLISISRRLTSSCKDASLSFVKSVMMPCSIAFTRLSAAFFASSRFACRRFKPVSSRIIFSWTLTMVSAIFVMILLRRSILSVASMTQSSSTCFLTGLQLHGQRFVFLERQM